MKTFQTEVEIAAGGELTLHGLPFRAGERVAVTILAQPKFEAMRSYAELLAGESGKFVEETQDHATERLLREIQW